MPRSGGIAFYWVTLTWPTLTFKVRAIVPASYDEADEVRRASITAQLCAQATVRRFQLDPGAPKEEPRDA